MRTTILLLLLCVISLNISAREGENGFGVAVGAAASFPHGVKLEAGVRLTSHLCARAGVSFLPGINAYDNEVSNIEIGQYKSILGYNPTAQIKAVASSKAGHLLMDFHPFRDPFHITAGIYLGRPVATADILLLNPQGESIMQDQTMLDPNNMPKVTITNSTDPNQTVTLQPSPDATLQASLHLGRRVQPYVGLGSGYAVPQSPISFSIDFGIIFNGKMQISSPNITNGNADFLLDYSGNKTISDLVYYTQILPVLNIGVNVRIN